jgi:hypothetical protein
VVSPAHSSGAFNVFVTTPGGTSPYAAADVYTYSGALLPVVTNLSPSSGPVAGGTSVTITGTGFTGATKVTFGGTAGTGLTVVSATSINVVSPAHSSGAFNVFVTTPGGTSPYAAADVYTYQ